jgi:hypothetical protein
VPSNTATLASVRIASEIDPAALDVPSVRAGVPKVTPEPPPPPWTPSATLAEPDDAESMNRPNAPAAKDTFDFACPSVALT